MVTDPQVFQLLVAAQNVSRKTGSAFDVTVGRLTRIWGFPMRQPKIPEEQTLVADENAGWSQGLSRAM